MQRRIFLACAVLMTAMAGAALAADITGNWTGSSDQFSLKFTFKQDGEKLTGMYAGSLGEAPITGTIKGTDATWQFTTDPKKGPAIYTGKFDAAGKMAKGDIDFAGIAKGTFTGKKVK